MKSAPALMLPALLAAGCAPYQYHPAPVFPPAIARQLTTRSLDDPSLRTWMQNTGQYPCPTWPLQSWDLQTLTLAAWYFNPDLDVARAHLEAASAAITTAAMKPNPTAGIGPGYETAPESPFMLTFDFSVPIETAGKRADRISFAQHGREAARIQVAEAAWAVRSRVRAAWVNYIFAARTADLLRQQVALQSRYAELLQRRFQAGEIPLPETATAQIDLTNLRQALRTAQGQVSVERASLASAIGVPDAALAEKQIIWPEADSPPRPSELPSAQIRDAAVLNRLDVERALAEYKAAQARLQLEVARQYPDVELGPGYGFEEGYHLISLSLSSVLPLRNHNQGPIAEAEAERKVAGAQLLAAQSTVIADTGKSLAQYQASWNTLAESRQAVRQVETQYLAAQQAFTAGEGDQLTVTAAGMQRIAAERSSTDALLQTQRSLGLLEDALQRPIAPSVPVYLPPEMPREQEKLP